MMLSCRRDAADRLEAYPTIGAAADADRLTWNCGRLAVKIQKNLTSVFHGSDAAWR